MRRGVLRCDFFLKNHVLDVDRRELRRGDELIAVEPQVFDLLVFLVQNRDRVVSKDDLIKGVWDGRIVSESTLTSRITAVRKAIGDSGEEQRLIRTCRARVFALSGCARREDLSRVRKLWRQRQATSPPADPNPRCAARQAVDRRHAIPKHERRPEPGILC